MTERTVPFTSHNQPHEDTGFISREAFEEHKKRAQEKKLQRYIDELSEAELLGIRSTLEHQIETFEALGKQRPDLREELLVVRQAMGVRQEIARELEAAEASNREAADKLRSMLAVVERQPGGALGREYTEKNTPIEQLKQSEQADDTSEEPLLDVGPQIRVNGVLTDVSHLTDDERRECVAGLRNKGEKVALVKEASIPGGAAQYDESDVVNKESYVRRGDLAMLPEVARQMEELAEARRQAGEPEMSRDERIACIEELSVRATAASSSDEVLSADAGAMQSPEYIPTAEDIRRGARTSSRVIDFVKKRPALAGIGALVVAAAVVTPLGVSKLTGVSQEVATSMSLELPEGGIELASECITADTYDKAPTRQVINGVVPFDLKKPDGTSYKFNDDKGTVRVGNDIILTGADAYLGVCAVDEKTSAVSVDGMTITIHRDKVRRQIRVAPSDVKGAVAAHPVDADMAGKLVFKQPENKEKLASYFEKGTFEALVHNGAAAIGERALKDEAIQATLSQTLDEALVKDVQDDIASIAKRSKVEADKVITELQGDYSQFEVLDVKKGVEGATVIDDRVTVEVAKGK